MKLCSEISSNDNKNMTLIQIEDTSRYFSASYLALKDFLKYIRTYPDIVYKILKLANQKYLTNDFADFILNNFYEDILNPITISKDFLYVIEHLLRDIVGQCDTPNDFEKIYKESNLALFINNVICMKEVKIYFNSILGNIINKYICSDKSSKILFFEINELNNFIKNRENNYKRIYRNSDYIQKQELKKIQNLYTKSINSIIHQLPEYIYICEEIKNIFSIYQYFCVDSILKLFEHIEILCFDTIKQNLNEEYKRSIDKKVQSSIRSYINTCKKGIILISKNFPDSLRKLISRYLVGKRSDMEIDEQKELKYYISQEDLWEEDPSRDEELQIALEEFFGYFQLTVGQCLSLYDLINNTNKI